MFRAKPAGNSLETQRRESAKQIGRQRTRNRGMESRRNKTEKRRFFFFLVRPRDLRKSQKRGQLGVRKRVQIRQLPSHEVGGKGHRRQRMPGVMMAVAQRPFAVLPGL